jgi:hypothetical protein
MAAISAGQVMKTTQIITVYQQFFVAVDPDERSGVKPTLFTTQAPSHERSGGRCASATRANLTGPRQSLRPSLSGS